MEEKEVDAEWQAGPAEGYGSAWEAAKRATQDDSGAFGFWIQNLPPEELLPQERERVRPARTEEDHEIQWDQWYASHPFWRGQRLFTLLAFLGAAAVLFLFVNPLKALNWLAGPEDPPLRLVQPDQVTRQLGDGSWAAVPRDADIQPGSFLRSGDGRTGVLRVRGGGSIRLDRNSGLKVQRLVRRDDGSFQIRSTLYVGRAFVKELSTDTLPVDTVFTRIQPMRATYEVSHKKAPDGVEYTSVRVFAGKVKVGLDRGKAQDVVLEAGQGVQVASGRMGKVRKVEGRDPWEAWNLSWEDTSQVAAFREPKGPQQDYDRLKLPPMKPLPAAPATPGAPAAAPVVAPGLPPGRDYPGGTAAPRVSSGGVPPASGAYPVAGPGRPSGSSYGGGGGPQSSGGGGSSYQDPPWGGGYTGGKPPVVNDSGATSYPTAAPVTNQKPPGY